ncbi:hypothetical protein LJ656_32395 [Paraburkholderia sp. MMS20-SJTR3]|uniref:Uncharacterized protein n=1 Tax=Paraburkholderia sejongensis TaxID=2886946 RepID=A0ABS8K542_9BURK|nr:hypothetical protein [Paraburkholderia sp. MMS20-SJTR3]MCC8397276.1 hypothetical protein [Paraburkholderia sp. MMS20-SJTR3]
MKRNFPCGHSGKGKYCHTCAAITQAKAAHARERQHKRRAKAESAAADPIDLSCVEHLPSVQNEARMVLAKVRDGTHPYALKGKPIRSSNGQLLSVPVGYAYRLMFDCESLRPLRLLSHEAYNRAADILRA